MLNRSGPVDRSKVGAGTHADPFDPCLHFRSVLRRNWQEGRGGVYAVCSAHPRVIDAAIAQALEDDSILHVESTSGQVNQFGGYTGFTPQQFAHFVSSAALAAGLPAHRVLLGGDHLGPFPWRAETADSAMKKAGELVAGCVQAGYQKIHLDPSMPCADDHIGGGTLAVDEQTIATRAAILCEAAEKAAANVRGVAPHLVYVIGTEVPSPGGEDVDSHGPTVTTADDVHRTLDLFHQAFQKRGLASAWERVVALVVQPGVDFGAESIFEYDAVRAGALSMALTSHEGIVYEAHSTDYQSPSALAQMVKDHFAILKVGPWLTFAFREAVLALSSIEQELFRNGSPCRLSQVREALENAMMRNPSHWRSYYQGNEMRRNLVYGYSDRCRYYWHESPVQEELTRLMNNLDSPIPLPLISQYFPEEYLAVRSGRVQPTAEQLIDEHTRQVLRIYSRACAEQL